MNDYSLRDVLTLKYLDIDAVVKDLKRLEDADGSEKDLYSLVACFRKYPFHFLDFEYFKKLIEDVKRGDLQEFTPAWINGYIHLSLTYDAMYPGFCAEQIREGHYRTLLTLLKAQYEDYQEHQKEYDASFDPEFLIDPAQDKKNGHEAGSMSVPTNPDWKTDWKEFIKHDYPFDGQFLMLLIRHKLELMERHFASVDHIEEAKEIHEQIAEALRLYEKIEEPDYDYSLEDKEEIAKDAERVEEERKAAKHAFFLYLADHYEHWWD